MRVVSCDDHGHRTEDLFDMRKEVLLRCDVFWCVLCCLQDANLAANLLVHAFLPLHFFHYRNSNKSALSRFNGCRQLCGFLRMGVGDPGGGGGGNGGGGGETINNLDGDRKLRPFVCRKFHFPKCPFSR